MVSSEMNNIIGQNCSEYEAESILSNLSIGFLARSCKNCTNYIDGKCVVGAYDLIKKMIDRN